MQVTALDVGNIAMNATEILIHNKSYILVERSRQ